MYSFAYKLSRSKCYFRISLFVMSMAISCHGDTLALWNVGVPFSTPNGITLLRTRASPKQGSTQGNSEHRPNFNNALTLGLYPVKERNFLKWNFLLRKWNVPPRDPLTKISLCNITSKYTENFLEGLYVHANWQSTMIINLLRVWWRRVYLLVPFQDFQFLPLGPYGLWTGPSNPGKVWR